MTAIAVPSPAITGWGNRLRWGLADSFTVTRRNLVMWRRTPALIVFTIVQPMMFMLLFRYVFGGAIGVQIKGGYVNYLLPGVVGQTAAFTSFGTAIALARELQKGSIDRLKSMPMARPAVLVGRLGADIVRLAVTIGILIGTGYAVGFRFENGAGPAILMVLLAVALGLALASVSAFIGLALKDEESVQAFGFIWMFPLTFVSAAFVPIASMPGWLQAFAKNQPISVLIEEMRALAIGGPLALHGWQSALWLLAIGGLFGSLAARTYRRV